MNSNNYKKTLILSGLFLVFILLPFIFKPFASKSYQEMIRSLPNFSDVTMFSKEKISTQIQNDQYMFFESDQIAYNKYEKINFKLGVVDKKTGAVKTNITPIIKIYNEEKKLLKNIFDQEDFTMIFNKELNIFEYQLYLKDINYEGILTAIVTFDTNPFYKKIEQQISIVIRSELSKYLLPQSYTFLGLDSKEVLSLRKILSTNGQETSFSEITKWFDLLNTDAIIMPSAITKTFETENTIWDIQKLKESKLLANTFSKAGQDVALWIQALEIDGLDVAKYNYLLSKSTNKNIQDKSIISLNDQKRKEELQLILKDHMKDSSIDFVGFTGVFFSNYHEELFSEFSNIFKQNIATPMHESFIIWTEYKAVAYFRELINSSNKDKPVFFIFTGEELSSNSRILDMAFATGVDFVFLDLSVSTQNLSTQFNLINRDNILDKYKDKIVLSYCLNYNNVVSGQSSAIDNWINYNLNLYNDYNVNTIRIKDFYRAMFGNRGSYLAYEWMLSIGDLIGKWKQSERYYPLFQKYNTSKVNINDTIELIIEFQNISLYNINDISIDLFPLIETEEKNILSLKELLKGEIYRTNIIISNIQFKKSLLTKRSRFIGFKSSFKQKQMKNNKAQERIHLISFIDPSVASDQILSVEDDFNEQMRISREQELIIAEEEKVRQRQLSNQLMINTQKPKQTKPSTPKQQEKEDDLEDEK